nr:hypothetical protein [Candidatus Kapabacteria bacterium]
KLKEANEYFVDKLEKPFTRKDQILKYLESLDKPYDILSEFISFRELFKLTSIPDEFKDIDLQKIFDSWLYTFEYSYVLGDIYDSSLEALESKLRHLEAEELSEIKNWKIDDYSNPDNNKKVFHKNDYPSLPRWIGDTATVEPIYNWE